MILESPAKKHAGRRRGHSLADSEAQRACSVHDGADVRSRQRHRELSEVPALVPRCADRCRLGNTSRRRSNRRARFSSALSYAQSLQRPERIGIDLVSGPFRRLRGEWRFVPAGVQERSLVDADLRGNGIAVRGRVREIFEELAASQWGRSLSARRNLWRRHVTGRSPHVAERCVQVDGSSASSRSMRVTRSFSKWTTTHRWIDRANGRGENNRRNPIGRGESCRRPWVCRAGIGPGYASCPRRFDRYLLVEQVPLLDIDAIDASREGESGEND